ncbi:MAG: hypothetical protein U5J83_06055 [Bryobacterales bacterium]|nr:hypothetical protein [Bryobacterales bacterium]
MIRSSLALFACLLFSATALAQPKPFDVQVLYGASYYHEYMPEERLEKEHRDDERQANITVIRLGESTLVEYESSAMATSNMPGWNVFSTNCTARASR